jgi:hypothetical protein
MFWRSPCARSAHGGSTFLSSSFVRWTSISVSKPRHNDRPLARQPEYATFDELISEALIHNLAKVGVEGSNPFARAMERLRPSPHAANRQPSLSPDSP